MMLLSGLENPVPQLYDKFEIFSGFGTSWGGETLINLNVAIGTMRWEGVGHDHAVIVTGMEHWLITKHVFYMFLAVFIVLGLFIWARARAKNDLIPRGLHNFIEPILMFIRDEIVYPNIKDPHHHDDHGHGGGHGAHEHHETHKNAKRFLPLIAAFFFFIVTMNLVGLVPGASTPTASIVVTAGLALITLLTYLIGGIVLQKPFLFGFFKNLVPACPWYMWPMLFVIELAGLIIKPVALMIRLFANMTAGHCVILSLTGMAAAAVAALGGVGIGVGVVATLASAGIYCLEVFVAVVQAYIFALLSAIFIGLYVAPEH
ncbi:MAG: F0F1 ATP synthase subunit A [Planctomycetes bacterium]|nr:F0F1 ATP synthase subunit A [Planctomycetota bacterium]NUQ35382.1 F0F1 ATP synthase subunit A [Planctomycetaceae bacterium]